jgi:SARP family transcriptional regulator, regulator of embCAB operon
MHAGQEIYHYEILGSLRVRTPGGERALRSRKQETLLVTLLSSPGHPVPIDKLIVELWADEPPKQARACLYVYVSQLRKVLRQSDGNPGPIATTSNGYVLHLEPDTLDAQLFSRHLTAGRALLHERRHAEAVVHLECALGYWRGPAVGGLRGGLIVEGLRARLENARVECLDLLISVYLATGQHQEIVGQLYSLIAEFPMRESFYRYLMIALYCCGRRAEAVEIYHRARGVFVKELGLEPGRALADVFQAVLVEDETFVEAGRLLSP